MNVSDLRQKIPSQKKENKTKNKKKCLKIIENIFARLEWLENLNFSQFAFTRQFGEYIKLSFKAHQAALYEHRLG